MKKGFSFLNVKSFFCMLGLLPLLFKTSNAHAVPLSILQFSAGTQADVTWARLENERFIVYYDAQQPTLGEHALKSLEAAFSDFSLLLGTTLSGQPLLPSQSAETVKISRFKKIPVIISARTDGASFANFFPQTIEIQSTRRPPASLFQHELAHRMMYEHIDLSVGPAGRAFMLAMLPTWWTEGLPEYLTESLGRLKTEGILRSMALNDSFLSWDRLHALYKSAGLTSELGYATSGRFFKYFLEKTPHKNLQKLHESLRNYQLIPPFFSGAYWLIHSLTGKWPGDLYEDFKTDFKKNTLDYLEGMPRLKDVDKSQIVFNQFNDTAIISNENQLIYPDFATDSRAGGLVVLDFNDTSLSKQVSGKMRPLDIVTQDQLAAHRKDIRDGGFWSARTLKAPNKTQGSQVAYYGFSGSIADLNNDSLKPRIDFPVSAEDESAPITDALVAIAPKTAAVLSVRDTATKLFLMSANSQQHTLLKEWSTPHHVQLIRHHDAYAEAETTSCAHVIVNSDHEQTALEKHCLDAAPETLIPAGTFLIQDALFTGPDSFILLVGWNNIQALMTWKKGHAELISGVPDWISTLFAGPTEDQVLLRTLTGEKYALWTVSLKSLRTSHLEWLIKTPESSRWWQPPTHSPYTPPFARYAQKIRGDSNAITTSNSTAAPTLVASNSTEDVIPASDITPDTAIAVVPAPYRFRHWMTYPNIMLPFLSGGLWSYGVFSRPIVDEMERFYAQFFFSYLDDPSVSDWIDKAGFELNVFGNRIFDGWRANSYFRPRFNGVAYGFRCRLSGSAAVVQCAQRRRSANTQYTQYVSLREYGLDFEWRRNFVGFPIDTKWTAKLFSIHPNSGNIFSDDEELGAQTATLISGGGSVSKNLWRRTYFTKPVEELDKESVSVSSNINLGFLTTSSISDPKAGDGTALDPVDFQNYSIELKNSASFKSHNINLIHFYSATGGDSPLNLEEFFQPFKTYLIGSNDGLQDISTSLAGNGLLNYRLVGKAQYRNSLSYSFPIVKSVDTRFALAYLERLEGEVVLSRGGVSDNFGLDKTVSLTTLTGSARLTIDVKGYRFYPAILCGKSLDTDLWQLFTQLRFDQFW